MNRFFLALFVTLSSTLLGVFFGVSSVNAQTIYDDWYETTDSLKIGRESTSSGTSSCDFEDYTINWSHLVLESGDQSKIDSFNAALDGGSWGVMQVSEPHPNSSVDITWYGVQVVWSETYQDFDITTGHVPVTNMMFIYQGVGSNCNFTYVDGSNDVRVSNHRSILFLNYNTIYPTGYEGEIIPDSYTEREEYDWTPDLYMVNSVDFNVTFRDKNFNTFDGIPFTCPVYDTAPVIEWYIGYYEDNDYQEIASGVNSPTVQIEQQLEEPGEYILVGQYYCGDDETDPIFTDGTSVFFTLTEAGTLEYNIIEDCVTDQFPFINFPNCLENMASVINLLSFNKLKWGNEWNAPENCYTLTVLGDWIGAEGANKTLCPMFSTEVRDTVTPFVTLLLGLTTISFVASRGGGGFS